MSEQEAKDYLIGKGWAFVKKCSTCSGGGWEYKKRDYQVKLYGTVFKLYHQGQHTNTQPMFNLDATIKDI